MNEQVRYVTDSDGQTIGVLLDIAAYHRLIAAGQEDPELLTGLSREELQALAESRLAPGRQAILDELWARRREDALSDDEVAELDHLLAQVDHLTTLKTRARYTLRRQQSPQF